MESLESRTLLAGDIALLYSDIDSRGLRVQEALQATGAFDSVASIAVNRVTPSLQQLESYEAVLVYREALVVADADALGDVLAHYVERGGGVVLAGSTFLAGRWENEGYSPFLPRVNFENPPQSELGQVYVSNHPVLEGVDGVSAPFRHARLELAPNAMRVADWADGLPFLADVRAPGSNRHIVGLNLRLPPDTFSWGEVPRILTNALNYSATGDLGSVLDVIDVLPDPRNNAVETVDVVFASSIDPATFDHQDLVLRRNGGPDLITPAVTTSFVSGNRYRLSGLTQLTGEAGHYSLLVNGSGIKDSQGVAGRGFRKDSWTNDQVGPTVLDIGDVGPDPRNGNSKPVDGIFVTFNERINPTSFDYRDIKLTREGGPNLIDASVTVSRETYELFNDLYFISGLAPLTAAAGEYEFTVSAVNVVDLAGNPGAGFAVDRWVANDPPVIGNIGPAVTYTEGDVSLQLLANTTTVSDLEVMFPGGSLRVLGGKGGHDRLTIRSAGTGPGQISRDGDNVRYQGVLIGVVSGGVGTNPLYVDLNQNATIDAATALLKAITFHNVNTGNLSPLPRTMRFELEDGAGGTGVATKNITVVPVNDAPRLDGVSGSSGYRLGENAIQIAPSAMVRDPDSADFEGGRLVVEITQGAGAENRIYIRGAFTVNADNEVFHFGVRIGTVNAGGGTGTTKLAVTFNANANRVVVQQLIRQLRFRTTAAAPVGNRSLVFTLTDGDGGTSDPVARTILVST